MALSDCVKCWDTPCTCGYDYRQWNRSARIKQAAIILGIPETQLAVIAIRYIPKDHPMRDEE